MCEEQSRLLSKDKESLAVYQEAVRQLTSATSTSDYLLRARKARQLSDQCAEHRERVNAHGTSTDAFRFSGRCPRPLTSVDPSQARTIPI